MSLKQFTEAYIEAALWSSTDDDGEPLDKQYSMDDFYPECRAKIDQECQAFYDANHEAWAAFGNWDEQAGHDFWLTRNRHGSGFWDRDFYNRETGERLTELAHEFGEAAILVHNGKLHYYVG